VVRHELQTALPFFGIEIGVPKPGVAIISGTAPGAFTHVVVEMDVYALLRELCGYGIEYLHRLI
jgi:hypothetical protein